jgi:chromate transport protein ChrA
MREVEAAMKSSERVSALTLFSYFFRLSCTALGGPLAYISMMEDECVERKQWLSRDEFTEMLGVTNMLPGPNATEMAIHIGYVKAGRIGGVLSGLGFTAPSFFHDFIVKLALLSLQCHAKCRRTVLRR